MDMIQAERARGAFLRFCQLEDRFFSMLAPAASQAIESLTPGEDPEPVVEAALIEEVSRILRDRAVEA